MTTQTSTDDAFDVSCIGRWSEPEIFEVTRERIRDYAAATNETLGVHLSGDQAPPVFAVVPAFMSLTSVVMEPVPMHLMFKILHGEQDIRIHRPIVPGDVLSTCGRVIGIHGKSSGVVVSTHLRTSDQRGDVVNEQYFAGFFRGGKWSQDEGEPFPAHELPSEVIEGAPVAVVTQQVDADQTWRYAAASGDPMPIHTDDEFARSLGFPGVILHGLCTMAFATRALVEQACPGAPQRLSRVAVRFGATGFPSDQPTTTMWGVDAGSRWRYGFQTTAADRVLIKDGLVEVRS